MSSGVIGAELVKQLAVLSQGRDPGWVNQSDYDGTPETGTAGVNVIDAIVAMVALGLRRDPAAHASRVTIDTVDLTSSTYTVTVDGNAVAYDASAETPADQAELVEGIASAINTDGTVGGLVTATIEDTTGDGTVDTIVLTNNTNNTTTHTTSVGVSGVGSTGVISFDEDADAAKLRLWLLADQANDTLDVPVPWLLANGGDFDTALDYRGFIERFHVAGASRVYVEAYDVTGPSGTSNGAVQIKIGPGVLES